MEIWRMRNKFPSCFQLVKISFKKEISFKMEALFKTKQNKHGGALHKVKLAFAWKIWLLSLFLNGKAFT
jgi:hypothetical protein